MIRGFRSASRPSRPMGWHFGTERSRSWKIRRWSVLIRRARFTVGLDTGEMFRTRQVILLSVSRISVMYPRPWPIFRRSTYPIAPSTLMCAIARQDSRHHRRGFFGARPCRIDARAGVDVQLVARKPLKFHSKSDKPRPWWDGCGGLHRAWGPDGSPSFSRIPQPISLSAGEPASRIGSKSTGTIWRGVHPRQSRGESPNSCRDSVEASRIEDGKVHLTLVDGSGGKRDITADHVIAATGYKVNLQRLKFLSDDTRSRIKTVAGSPALSSLSSRRSRGLYFVGLAAANSFGPVMRFAFGADLLREPYLRAGQSRSV